jgi:MiaB-like tRNA modifying enzyme
MKVYIRTFGCSANKSDSEIMAGLLAQAGHKIVSSAKDADLVVINSCGVKGRAEIDFFREVEAARKLKKKIIAAGCIPSGNKLLIETKLRGISVMDINSITQIALVAEETCKNKRIILFGKNKIEKICLPRQRLNKVIAIVPICEGCVGSCAYCFTKLAKGNLFSYSENAILNEVRTALADGCKEIWLTSQDCAAYGLDANTNLSKLLEKICKIPGDFHIRVGMGNPNHIIKILPELIEAYKNKKVFKFLHIPIQSGNDRVLKLMNRFYTVGDFKKIVKEFRKQITNLTLITDIICGFPTETEKEFEDSVKLITWLQPDAINVSMFWPRPGTIAEKMKQLSGEIKKKRSREMTKLYHSVALDVNKKLVGKKFKVLVDEIGKKGGFVARNESYKPIVLKESKLKLGDSPQVRIISATKNYLIGEI